MPNRNYEHVGETFRWFETPSKDGLRFVGFSDGIELHSRMHNIRHNGWYTNEFYDEVLRGMVFQLPSRKGEYRYLAAICDPNQDEPANVCITSTFHDLEACAIFADRLAELSAEKEREYNEKWQAQSRCEDIETEISDIRKDALQLIAEIKTLKSVLCDKPNIIDTLRNDISSARREIAELRDERENLKWSLS